MNNQLTEQQVRTIVQDEMAKNYVSGNPQVPPHQHDGTDNFQIDPDNLLGFSIRTVTPTDPAPNGTILLSNIAGTRKIWARIANAWYSVTIT